MHQQEKNRPKACVVIPTYNEEDNIEKTLLQVLEVKKTIKPYNLLILVVDDNSPDDTQTIIKKLMELSDDIHMITGAKVGLGDAYTRGFSYALEKWNPSLIIQMDADGQHDPSIIKQFITLAVHGKELIIGSRFIEGSSTPNFSNWRRFISLFGNFLVRYLGGVYMIKDCTSGFRCINTDLLKQCNLDYFSTKGYSFQSSLVCELMRNGANAVEIPIVFNKREHGLSKLTLHDEIEFLINIVKIRFRNSEDFLRYCIVGALGVCVNFLTYFALTRFAGWAPELSSPIAIELSIISNFVCHNLWTFVKRIKQTVFINRFFKFHIVAGIAGIINYAFFITLINALILNDLISLFLGIAIGTIFNYAGNSLWTFRKPSL
jgi:dolichol-phosphate mannosyltransferase